MKKFKLLSLVGSTSIALTHAGWADGHGGGGAGGFGGGGHGGDGGASVVVVTLEAEEASVVVVTLEAEEASVVVVTLEAAAEVESASAERASQVEFRTLMAESPAPLHL